MKQTTTEKYINKAVQKAKEELSGTHMTNTSVHVDAQVQTAWEDLIQCVQDQIKVNSETVNLLNRIAGKLENQNIYGIQMTNK